MKTFAMPPLVPTEHTPETLLSSGDFDYLYRHCRDYRATANPSERAIELISLLGEYGYVIDRISNNGRIIFGQIKKGVVQQEFDRRAQFDGFDQKTGRELRELARNNFRSMMGKMASHKVLT